MLVNAQNLRTLGVGYSGVFHRTLQAAKATEGRLIATLVKSTGKQVDYAGLAPIGGMKEWVGPRVIEKLEAHDYSIKNKRFQEAVGVQIDDIADDNLGLYPALFEELAIAALRWESELVMGALAAGTSKPCFDGEAFFSAAHPNGGGDHAFSNLFNAGGGEEPWYLLDNSRALKALILQIRLAPMLQQMNKPDDEGVFMNDEVRFGIKSRGAAGYGLPHLASRNEGPLNATNFETMLTNMRRVTNPEGKRMGVKPTLLIVGPGNVAAARRLLKAQTLPGGGTNTNFNRVEVLESDFL